MQESAFGAASLTVRQERKNGLRAQAHSSTDACRGGSVSVKNQRYSVEPQR